MLKNSLEYRKAILYESYSEIKINLVRVHSNSYEAIEDCVAECNRG